MRFRLRTLLIVLAVGPPAVAGAWLSWQEWRQVHAVDSAMAGYWLAVAFVLGIPFGIPLLVFTGVLVRGILSWIKPDENRSPLPRR